MYGGGEGDVGVGSCVECNLTSRLREKKQKKSH